MDRKIINFVAKLLKKTEAEGLRLTDEKPMKYGVQLFFSQDDNLIPLNVYYSKKKGISHVIGGSPNNTLRPILQKVFNKNTEQLDSDHDWVFWAGTDESGKGDFFGALVVCGFIVHKNESEQLRELGVLDSKKLNDKKIIKIATKLQRDFNKNFEVIVLRPAKYNELYGDFRKQGKKLNELLAWMHSRIIINLHEEHNFEGAVVDKFASDRTLISSLKGMRKIKLQHKIKAEQDMAVAAASILARYFFLKSLKVLSKKYKMEFSKGASKKVVKNAQQFADKFGKNELVNVAKIHFKTYDRIKG